MLTQISVAIWYGPLTRYVKLRVAHAPGIPGTFSPPPRFSDPDMHQVTCVTHVPWCMPGSLTSDFFWNRWRGKRSRHSRRMRNPQFYVSGKRPIARTEWVNSQRNIGLKQVDFIVINVIADVLAQSHVHGISLTDLSITSCLVVQSFRNFAQSTKEQCFMGKREIARFEYKMSFGWIFHITVPHDVFQTWTQSPPPTGRYWSWFTLDSSNDHSGQS